MKKMSGFTMLRTLCVWTVIIGVLGAGCASFANESHSPLLTAVPARGLLLDTNAFPKGWVAGTCEPDCSRSEGETHALRSFYIINIPGQVVQEVFRLGSEQDAIGMFQTARDTDFRERQSPNSGFAPPPEISYQSLIADEYHLGCGVDEVPACKVIMRKGNYFISVFFNVDRGEVGGNGLKMTEIAPILRDLDERVAGHFGTPIPTVVPTLTQ
jgi:hypothetical protein